MSVIKIRIGQPEQFVPSAFSPKPLCGIICADASMLRSGAYTTEKTSKSYGIPTLQVEVSHRGLRLQMPMDHSSGIYGLGLQLKSFQHRGSKKTMRVNADPRSDSGDSHAPVPFFVTTEGYGLYLDTARNVEFFFSRQLKHAGSRSDLTEHSVATNTAELYAVRKGVSDAFMTAEIPRAQGVDAYFITGDTILDIVSQYNMLSGGGCMPPMWGLGVFYRCYSRFGDEQVLDMAESIRHDRIPCDVIGLEPGWQTHAYSCTYIWKPSLFSNPKRMISKLTDEGFRLNLWEHAFIHPSCPLNESMMPYAGDHLVWEGLVPDFTFDEAKERFAEFQRGLVTQGVTGFKLDECDNSDFTGGWSFPDYSRFPSGIDGEQYHHLFGQLYAQTIQIALDGIPTWSQVRNMGALAASYPFVLYSDLYDQQDYLKGVVNAGFSGLMWSPEVREAKTKEELIRRLQNVIFSHQALVNAWYLETAPWQALDCVDAVRSLFEWRMRLVPYLYNAFYEYQVTGRPPIRALVCDYQNDMQTWDCADEYMFGDSMIVAPILYPQKERNVYLPDGEWFDLFTHEKFSGGIHTRCTDGIPVYVKSGTILPLAEPVQYINSNVPLDITLTVFGDCRGKDCRLIDESEFELKPVYYSDADTCVKCKRYRIIGVDYII